jgi:hypothetical protein
MSKDILSNVRLNFQQKRLTRWFIFTYPKTTTLFGVTLLSLYVYIVNSSTKANSDGMKSITNAVYAQDNKAKRTMSGALIYDGSITRNDL